MSGTPAPGPADGGDDVAFRQWAAEFAEAVQVPDGARFSAWCRAIAEADDPHVKLLDELAPLLAAVHFHAQGQTGEVEALLAPADERRLFAAFHAVVLLTAMLARQMGASYEDLAAALPRLLHDGFSRP